MAPNKQSAKRKAVETPVNVIKKGIYVFPNGDKYDGEFILNDDNIQERNGSGVHTTSDGAVYQGHWKDDKMNGQGEIKFPTGCRYKGYFIDNKMEGFGVFEFANKSFYYGNFINNKLDGEGQFIDTMGQTWLGLFHKDAAPGLRFKISNP